MPIPYPSHTHTPPYPDFPSRFLERGKGGAGCGTATLRPEFSFSFSFVLFLFSYIDNLAKIPKKLEK
jgi:hypothetical protein